DAHWRSTHHCVVVVRAKNLPSRAIDKLDVHLLIILLAADFFREGLVNTLLTGARIDRVPDGFTGLRSHGEHVPISAYALKCGYCGAMQGDFILAGASTPDQFGMFATALEIVPSF